jgi:hypothetical protein
MQKDGIGITQKSISTTQRYNLVTSRHPLTLKKWIGRYTMNTKKQMHVIKHPLQGRLNKGSYIATLWNIITDKIERNTSTVTTTPK